MNIKILKYLTLTCCFIGLQELNAQSFFQKLWNAISLKPVWGEYTEGSNTNRNPPLTTAAARILRVV